MALSKQTLKEGLLNLFDSMGSNADNEAFASRVSSLLASYLSAASVSTTDAGTVSAGAFEGSGTGSLTVTSADCKDTILDVCNAMDGSDGKGNDYFAEGLGDAVQALADSAFITTSVTGQATSGSTVTELSGMATGEGLNISTSSLVSALKDCFSDMWDNRGDEPNTGNEDFAETLASEVHSLFTASGTVSTSGQLVLEGSTGSGKLS